MRIGRPRLLLAVLLVAVAIGLAAAWLAGAWSRSTPESRAREAVEGLRDRVRELTH